MNPSELREMVGAFQKSRIVLTAYELEIFTYISDKHYSSQTIAEALSLDTNATERLLNALVAIHLLEKHEDKFTNTTDSLRYLSKDSKEYVSGLMHSNHLWDTWSNLTHVVKTGNAAQSDEINERGEEWLEAFIHAMHYRGKKQAPAQIADIDLQNVESVLDVGGGSGCFIMAFLDRKPRMQAAVFDLPNVVPISKRIIDEEGYTGKIVNHTGDFTEDELPGDFDLVFLSAIIHSNDYETNQELVKKCYRALNKNGKIVIQDWIMNNAKTQPLQGAIFSINMLVGVKGGDCYSEEEVTDWMEAAGFTHFSRVSLNSGLSQMIGVKKSD